MKVLLLNSFLLIILFQGSAQSYFPFVTASDSSDSWNDQFSCWDGQCYWESRNVFVLNGDTSILGNLYYKVYVKETYIEGIVVSPSCPVSNTTFPFEYYGAIREDMKKVYLHKDSGPEYLIYDFNLNVGDTVPDPQNITGNEYDRIITNIDQVLVNGQNRKRYTLQGSAEIVEGIGSNTGPFRTVSPYISCTCELICYSENGQTIYGDQNCAWNLSVEQLNLPDKTLIKTLDLLGRETEDKPNTVLIHVFSDGTTEKVYRVE